MQAHTRTQAHIQKHTHSKAHTETQFSYAFAEKAKKTFDINVCGCSISSICVSQ